ncbi:MAG: sulfur carrier protein ThiS [Planctomycetota bacterium]
MEIHVNGEAQELPDGSTLTDLLGVLALTGTVAIELNREVVPRAEHAGTTLNAGDRVEIVTIVGGG